MDVAADALSQNLVFSAPCTSCGKARTYKNKQNYLKSKDKLCLSCTHYSKSGAPKTRVNALGEICCSSCFDYKIEKHFHKHKSSGKPYSRCIDCHRNQSKMYFKEVYRYAQYGLTKEEYGQLVESQNNKCAGCQENMEDPHVDHDHATNRVRGLLCHGCNAALGLIKDDTNTLNNLIKYLEKK